MPSGFVTARVVSFLLLVNGECSPSSILTVKRTCVRELVNSSYHNRLNKQQFCNSGTIDCTCRHACALHLDTLI